MSDKNIQQENNNEKKTIELTLDTETGFKIKILEFDKNIAAAEEVVARIKKERATFIFDQNVQCLLSNSNKK